MQKTSDQSYKEKEAGSLTIWWNSWPALPAPLLISRKNKSLQYDGSIDFRFFFCWMQSNLSLTCILSIPNSNAFSLSRKGTVNRKSSLRICILLRRRLSRLGKSLGQKSWQGDHCISAALWSSLSAILTTHLPGRAHTTPFDRNSRAISNDHVQTQTQLECPQGPVLNPKPYPWNQMHIRPPSLSQNLDQILDLWTSPLGSQETFFLVIFMSTICKIRCDESWMLKHKYLSTPLFYKLTISKYLQTILEVGVCLLETPLEIADAEDRQRCVSLAPSLHRVNSYFPGLACVQSKTWPSACCLLKLGKTHLQCYEKHIAKGNTCKLNLLSYEEIAGKIYNSFNKTWSKYIAWLPGKTKYFPQFSSLRRKKGKKKKEK